MLFISINFGAIKSKNLLAMKRIIFTVILSAFALVAFGQQRKRDSVSFEHIQPYVSTFEIKNGQLTGAGAEMLRKKFAQSQFVLLGERHNIAQISEFTEAVLAPLSSAGYEYFAVEVGPNSARKLMELSNDPDKTQEKLYQFNSRYTQMAGLYPIPFFSGVEDAHFLSEARRQGFKLWGIDQEFSTAPFYLFDDLLRKHENHPDYQKIQAKHEQAMDFMQELRRKKVQGDYDKAYYDLMHSQEIKEFFAALDQNVPEVQTVKKSLYQSWEIYYNWSNNIYKNLEARAALMKHLFSTAYKKAQEEDGKMPKVLIKMGNAHTQRGYTYNEIFDIGTLTHELAAFNGTHALNIAFEYRYYDFPWEKGDRLDKHDKRTKDLHPLLEAGQKDQWVVVDLRPLKEKMVKRELVMTKQIRELIISHDLIIMPAKYSHIEKNYVTQEL
jgi:hypothetical protein